MSKNSKDDEKLNLFLAKITKILKELLITIDLSKTINLALSDIGTLLKVDRVYIFENSIKDGDILMSQRYEWTNGKVTSELNNPKLQNLSYKEAITELYNRLSKNEVFEAIVKNLPKDERVILEEQGIKSILIIPIFVNQNWFGFIGFDDCFKERSFSNEEKYILSTLAIAIAGAIEKENKNEELKRLNLNLEKRVEEEVAKNREKEIIIFQQSKYTQMGEMLSMIAHEWRQPLNVVSSVIQNFVIKYQLNNTITLKDVEELENESMKYIQSMSTTIDKFRYLCQLNREKEEFRVSDIIKDVFTLVSAQFDNLDIRYSCNCENDVNMNGYRSELEQVIISIIKNSKDAFEEKKEIKDKEIWVDFELSKEYLIVTIKDNAGGVNKEIKDKIFNPYFTTKEPNRGTGLGLYLAKSIIENSMKGKIIVENIIVNDEVYGLAVSIKLPISK